MKTAIAFALLAATALNAQARDYKMTVGSSHPPVLPWTIPLKSLIVPESNKRLKARGLPDTIQWTEAYGGALYDFNGTLLFYSWSSSTRRATLWRSDGSAAGTLLAADINPGAAGASPPTAARTSSCTRTGSSSSRSTPTTAPSSGSTRRTPCSSTPPQSR